MNQRVTVCFYQRTKDVNALNCFTLDGTNLSRAFVIVAVPGGEVFQMVVDMYKWIPHDEVPPIVQLSHTLPQGPPILATHAIDVARKPGKSKERSGTDGLVSRCRRYDTMKKARTSKDIQPRPQSTEV